MSRFLQTSITRLLCGVNILKNLASTPTSLAETAWALPAHLNLIMLDTCAAHASILLPMLGILSCGSRGLQAFQLALEAAHAKAATTAFFDDSARNVAAGHAAGLFSVLVRASASAPPSHADAAPHHHRWQTVLAAALSWMCSLRTCMPLIQLLHPRRCWLSHYSQS